MNNEKLGTNSTLDNYYPIEQEDEMTQMAEQELIYEINQELRRCASCYHSISESRLAILTLFKQAGYVQLDEDQGLPKNPIGDFIPDIGKGQQWAYSKAQQDMLKAGFRRIRRE